MRYDASVRLSVRLSVTEVHWRIIANLGFKFRSHFIAHCGRRAAGGRRAARRAACGRIISRHAISSASSMSEPSAWRSLVETASSIQGQATR